MTEPNAVECERCSTITETDDPTEACLECDSTDTVPVLISPCPNPRGACDSEFHHYGRGDHVEILG